MRGTDAGDADAVGHGEARQALARRRRFGRFFRGLVRGGFVGGLRRCGRLGGRVAGFLGLGGFLFLGLALLARDRLFRIVALSDAS